VNKPWSNPDIRDIVAQAVEISLATRHACAGAIPVQEATEDQRAPEAILVAQKSRELFAIVNDGFGRTRPVCYAADVAAVLRTIEDQEVAMVLCELDEFDGADVMLKLLKQSHPQIQTVAVAATSDSASLISLINQAQILRFMTRPLRLGLLERALRSALAVHANYKARPVLSQRQKVQATPEVAESSIGRQILQRLAFLAKSRIGTS
jgi:DNA-binding NtrC family response regulator